MPLKSIVMLKSECSSKPNLGPVTEHQVEKLFHCRLWLREFSVLMMDVVAPVTTPSLIPTTEVKPLEISINKLFSFV